MAGLHEENPQPGHGWADRPYVEDAIAEESYRQLAATVARSSNTEPPKHTDSNDTEHSYTGPNHTEVVPVQSAPLPTLPFGENLVAASVVEPSMASRSQRRIVADFNTPNDGSLHHTLLPRTMVIAGLLAALGSPLVAFVLERQGHLRLDGSDWYFDDRGRSVATAVVVAVVSCAVLGWLWWTTAAALNARKQARYTVSPLFAPLLIVLMSACAFVLGGTLQADALGDDERTRKAVTVAVLIAVIVLCHFMILEAYRRAAGVIGASQRTWLLVILLPWATLAANGLAQFFAQAVGDSYLKVIAMGNMFVCGLQVLALYQAMSSFDRACSGRHMPHDDRGELPEFLRGH